MNFLEDFKSDILRSPVHKLNSINELFRIARNAFFLLPFVSMGDRSEFKIRIVIKGVDYMSDECIRNENKKKKEICVWCVR